VQEFLVVHEEIACQYTLEAQLLKQIAGGHGHLTKGILWIVALFGTSLAPPPTALKSSKSARNLERRSISNPTYPADFRLRPTAKHNSIHVRLKLFQYFERTIHADLHYPLLSCLGPGALARWVVCV
jgi:hypothetical protein